MKYLLLIFTLLIVISALSPNSLKIGNIKGVANSVLLKYKNNKKEAISGVWFAGLISVVYCILLAIYIKSFAFTAVMTYWIAQTLMECNMVNQYLEGTTDLSKIFTSYLYRWLSKLIDFVIYGYILYFIMMHW